MVFTVTLACTKRALFITKKGALKKIGGGARTPRPPGTYIPGPNTY